jgi:hypothetical protein
LERLIQSPQSVREALSERNSSCGLEFVAQVSLVGLVRHVRLRSKAEFKLQRGDMRSLVLRKEEEEEEEEEREEGWSGVEREEMIDM